MTYKTYKKTVKLILVDVKNLNYLLSYKSNERFFTLWGVGTPTIESL